MNTWSRWRHGCWAAGLALVLAGCGRGEAPKATGSAAPPTTAPVAVAPAGVEPAAGTGSVAAQPPVAKPVAQAPASLQEATRIIDFRKFPLPDGAKDLPGKSATYLSCNLGKVDAAKAAEFYRTKFTEAGWKLADDPSIAYGKVVEDKRYFMFTASKQGFSLGGGVFEDRTTGEVTAHFTNYGNIDSRTLPRFAGAEVKHSEFWGTTYRTDAKPDAVLEFTRTELEKGGWREVELPAIYKRDDRLHPRFIQRGIHIATHIKVQQGKSDVRYQLNILRVELPIMPEAKGTVEFLDGEKSLLQLFYFAPTEPENVLAFYKNALPDMGWTMRAGTDKIEFGKAKVMLDAPEKESLRLELLADKEGTFVLIGEGPGKEPKAKTVAKPAKKQPLVTEKELRFEGKLTKDSPKIQNSLAEVHQMKMSPDRTYEIDLESTDFDAYLRILDAGGKQLAHDDDSGDKRNARLRFTPAKEGDYQVVASVFGAGRGNYVLKIQVLWAREEKQP